MPREHVRIAHSAQLPHSPRQAALPLALHGALQLQRYAGNAATSQLIQRAWSPQEYRVDSSKRTLHLDHRTVLWGGAQNPNNYAAQRDDATRPRSILFETIALADKWPTIAARLRGGPLWDIGLTIVLNRPYTPSKTFDATHTQTKKTATLGKPLDDAKQSLDEFWSSLSGSWSGPPVQVVTAAWERRERENEDKTAGNKLEAVQASFPYATLRVIAATTAGATEIEKALRGTHAEFWRKIGDDDMLFVDPNNSVSPEMTTLGEVEQEANTQHKSTLVTFGYNLVTGGTQEPVTGILRGIYKCEMELRARIVEVGGPAYPSEPTTYYRPVQTGKMDNPWQLVEKQTTGGSGQQLEGAKLVKALRGTVGYQHRVFHTIMIETSAGARNDEIVALLNSWWGNGAGRRDAINEEHLEAAINRLDQSTLRADEYRSKVLGNLEITLAPTIYEKIEPLVTEYSLEALRVCKDFRAIGCACASGGYRCTPRSERLCPTRGVYTCVSGTSNSRPVATTWPRVRPIAAT
jgi:hypothetical protein